MAKQAKLDGFTDEVTEAIETAAEAFKEATLETKRAKAREDEKKLNLIEILKKHQYSTFSSDEFLIVIADKTTVKVKRKG